MQERRFRTASACGLSELEAVNGFVPLVREVVSLALGRTRLKRRINKRRARIRCVLSDARLGLADLVSDILGASARAVLSGIVEGEADLARLVARTQGRLKASGERLAAALQGDVRERHRVLLGRELAEVELLEQALSRVESRLSVQLCRLLTMGAVAANHNALGAPSAPCD